MDDINFIFIVIILIIFINYNKNKKESFSDEEIKKKSHDIYKNKELFVPGVTYSKIKSNITWIDPIMYNDVYKLSLKEPISISNLEKTIYNSIN